MFPTKEAVAQKFATPDGRIVDIQYGTSDGQLFFDPVVAGSHAQKLGDTSVKTYFRDESVRNMAIQQDPLQVMITLTDYHKLCKVKRTEPSYDEYLKVCKSIGMAAAEEAAYKFVRSKVFSPSNLVSFGQPDEIYMLKEGVVKANYVRSYPQGKVWSTGDRLVLTCPTHTELVSGTYTQIFNPLLNPQK